MPPLTINPFIRVITRENQVVGFNPSQVSTFNVESKAQHYRLKKDVVPLKAVNGALTNPKDDFEMFEADTLRLVFNDGKGLTYIVGEQITAEEFTYVCECLQELTFLTTREKQELARAEHERKLAESAKEFSKVE